MTKLLHGNLPDNEENNEYEKKAIDFCQNLLIGLLFVGIICTIWAVMKAKGMGI